MVSPGPQKGERGVSAFTAADKLRAVERELAYRRRVYPRMVMAGKMTDNAAAAQIAVMEAIEADYRAMAGKDAGPLFGKAEAS